MSDKLSEQNLYETTTIDALADIAAEISHATQKVHDRVTVFPTTDFHFAYQSSAGDARVIRYRTGGLFATGNSSGPRQMDYFGLALLSREDPTECVMSFTPDPVAHQQASFVFTVEGSVSGDLFICKSRLAHADLEVTLEILRFRPDGTSSIFNKVIRNGDEQQFPIP